MEPHSSRMDPKPLARYKKDLVQTSSVIRFFFPCKKEFQTTTNICLFSQVEIEVPQTCSFIVRTTGCSLSEVADMDTDGNPVFSPAPGSDAFAAEMEK